MDPPVPDPSPVKPAVPYVPLIGKICEWEGCSFRCNTIEELVIHLHTVHVPTGPAGGAPGPIVAAGAGGGGSQSSQGLQALQGDVSSVGQGLGEEEHQHHELELREGIE